MTPLNALINYSGTDVDPAVVRILEKSCQNCHYERTEWPWYSYVAPMSWLIEKDVHEARSHLNLSRWGEYDAQKQHDLLAELAAVVRSRRMPLSTEGAITCARPLPSTPISRSPTTVCLITTRWS